MVFEEYDFPGLKTEGGIAFTEGGYASKGARAAQAGTLRASNRRYLKSVLGCLPCNFTGPWAAPWTQLS